MSNGADAKRLASRIRGLQLNTEGVLKLLGGSADDRQKFIELVTGVTSRGEFKLMEQQLEVVQGLVTQADAALKGLAKTAKTLQT